jgi:hypothetical protein
VQAYVGENHRPCRPKSAVRTFDVVASGPSSAGRPMTPSAGSSRSPKRGQSAGFGPQSCRSKYGDRHDPRRQQPCSLRHLHPTGEVGTEICRDAGEGKLFRTKCLGAGPAVQGPQCGDRSAGFFQCIGTAGCHHDVLRRIAEARGSVVAHRSFGPVRAPRTAFAARRHPWRRSGHAIRSGRCDNG